MVEEEPVEEDLVGVLQRAQVDVPLQVVVFAPVGLVGSHRLLVQALDLRRQQAVQAELVPLVLRERSAFVPDRAVEEIDATGTLGERTGDGEADLHRDLPRRASNGAGARRRFDGRGVNRPGHLPRPLLRAFCWLR